MKAAILINRTYRTYSEKYFFISLSIKLYRWLRVKYRLILFSYFKIQVFYISPSELSFANLPHSAFASPARYMMEVFRRLRSLYTEPTDCLIFNPFFLLSPGVAIRVRKAASVLVDHGSIVVFADKSGVPIAYMLPGMALTAGAHYLSLVSTMNASLDALFLGTAFAVKARGVTVAGVSLKKDAAGNNFNYSEFLERIFIFITENALRGVTKRHLSHIAETSCMVVMPHHAGDALFLAKALNYVQSPVKAVLVNEVYADIFLECTKGIETVTFNGRPLLRDGVAKPDDEYFWDIISKVAVKALDGNMFYYFRPSREYRICDFHLIDQFSFALGQSYQNSAELIGRRRILNCSLPKIGDGQLKVLLHFEGGWPLKVYPEEFQRELIGLLQGKGFGVSVLTARKDYHSDVQTEGYSNLVRFKKLLGSHHLLIGMDSFPVHYAAHVAGSPTICLFSSTKPVNSDAQVSRFYKFLHKGLGCEGCFGFDTCPITKKHLCKNFSEPEEVFSVACSMLGDLYW